jgi:hypothetical protein
MDKAVGVRCVERGRDVRDESHRAASVEPAYFAKHSLEIAGLESHCDEWLALVPACLVDGEDRPMRDGRRQLRFALEALLCVGSPARIRGDQLERDRRVTLGMRRTVHRCHPAAADKPLDDVGRDHSSRLQESAGAHRAAAVIDHR